jgi:signal transduction histidine kinase
MRFLHQDADIDPQELRQNTLEAFQTINSTASGLLSFVESYRKFTSIPKPKKSDFVLNGLIEKVIRLHEPAIREKKIEVQLSVAGLVTVCADESLIMQVLINLVKNAVEAVEKDNGEKILITVSNHDLSEISLDVANTGNLIPADVLPHIFIPFFTTKKTGSGVGLSVSRYIMRLHGGRLQHFASPDKMTVFRLTLPVGCLSEGG